MLNSTTLKIIAHRGASGEYPENTLIAIQKAIEIGVDYIEFDIRITKDGIPVVIHDATLSRTTGKLNHNYVHDLTLAEIKKLDVGSWRDPFFANARIPTLEEVMQTASQTGLMIEIKEGVQGAHTIVTSILKVINTCNCNLDTIKFGSFGVAIIREIIMQAPTVNVMGIVEEADKIEEFLGIGITHLALWYKLITPTLMQRLHSDGITVWTFTVDDPEVVQFLASLSIEGVITNQPRNMISLIKH